VGFVGVAAGSVCASGFVGDLTGPIEVSWAQRRHHERFLVSPSG
jgi:hypothetical protein